MDASRDPRRLVFAWAVGCFVLASIFAGYAAWAVGRCGPGDIECFVVPSRTSVQHALGWLAIGGLALWRRRRAEPVGPAEAQAYRVFLGGAAAVAAFAAVLAWGHGISLDLWPFFATLLFVPWAFIAGVGTLVFAVLPAVGARRHLETGGAPARRGAMIWHIVGEPRDERIGLW